MYFYIPSRHYRVEQTLTFVKDDFEKNKIRIKSAGLSG